MIFFPFLPYLFLSFFLHPFSLFLSLSLSPSLFVSAYGCIQWCATRDPMGYSPPVRLLCPWNFPGKYTGAGCHFLLQGIFPTQGSNLCLLHLLHWQVDSLSLPHLGSHLSLFIFNSEDCGHPVERWPLSCFGFLKLFPGLFSDLWYYIWWLRWGKGEFSIAFQVNHHFAVWIWPELLVEFYVLPEKQTCRQPETGKIICSLFI